MGEILKLFRDKTLREEIPLSVSWGYFGFCLQGYFLRQKEAAAGASIFLRVMEKQKRGLSAEKFFPEQCSGRSSAHPSTHEGIWLSICSGAPQCASQELWVLAARHEDGSQCACQGSLRHVFKYGDGYFDWKAHTNSSKIKSVSFQCSECEQTKTCS